MKLESRYREFLRNRLEMEGKLQFKGSMSKLASHLLAITITIEFAQMIFELKDSDPFSGVSVISLCVAIAASVLNSDYRDLVKMKVINEAIQSSMPLPNKAEPPNLNELA